jgi:hypothetical protein
VSEEIPGASALLNIIPEDAYIDKVDLDAEQPYCEWRMPEDGVMTPGNTLFIPPQLAHYLAIHFCGSRKMREAMLEQGREEIRKTIKGALNIE